MATDKSTLIDAIADDHQEVGIICWERKVLIVHCRCIPTMINTSRTQETRTLKIAGPASLSGKSLGMPSARNSSSTL